MKKTLLYIAPTIGAIMTSQAAIILEIDPTGGEQDGVEFGSTTGGGLISQADMQTAISGASAGFSGVFDSSDMTGAGNGVLADTDDSSFRVLATGGVLRHNATRGEVQATSGLNHTWLLNGSTFSFDLGTTGATGVTHFGLVMVGWVTGGRLTNEFTLTANFSDASSASFNTDAAEAARTGGAGNGALDTWFGFQAPTGETITNVVLTRDFNSGNWAAFDDASFVLAEPNPEPSSTALLGLGALGLLLRRTR